MAVQAFSGLGSGVDTASLISQLMQLERQKLARPKMRERAISAQDTGLNDIKSKLNALKSSATALRSASTWANTQTVESSDAAKVGATRTANAAAGAYTIAVTKLAAAEQRTYAYSPPTAASQVTVGSATIDLAADATLDDAVAAINNASGSPVYATAVSGQLVLSARATGAASTFTATGDTIAEDAAKARLGADAEYTVDGGAAQKSATNTVANGLPGVQLSLKSLGTATVSVGMAGVDQEAVKSKVKAFVESYNAMVTSTRQRLGEKGVPNAKTESDAAKGQLFADRGLTSMLSRFRTGVTDVVAGNPAALDELREIGISTGAAGATINDDAVAGKLVLDESKLTAALASDPQAVKKLLGGVSDTAGFAQRIESLVDAETGTDGAIPSRLKSNEAQLRRVRDGILDTERRLATTEQRYKAQFLAMERVLSQSNAQGSWLTAQLGSMDR